MIFLGNNLHIGYHDFTGNWSKSSLLTVQEKMLLNVLENGVLFIILHVICIIFVCVMANSVCGKLNQTEKNSVLQKI